MSRHSHYKSQLIQQYAMMLPCREYRTWYTSLKYKSPWSSEFIQLTNTFVEYIRMQK